jgi:hypothetical protein
MSAEKSGSKRKRNKLSFNDLMALLAQKEERFREKKERTSEQILKFQKREVATANDLLYNNGYTGATISVKRKFIETCLRVQDIDASGNAVLEPLPRPNLRKQFAEYAGLYVMQEATPISETEVVTFSHIVHRLITATLRVEHDLLHKYEQQYSIMPLGASQFIRFED